MQAIVTKNSWKTENISAMEKAIPNLDPLCIQSRLIRTSISIFKFDIKSEMKADSHTALLAFELGSNEFHLKKFFDFEKLDEERYCTLQIWIILYSDIYDSSITNDVEFELAFKSYLKAFNKRYRVFRNFGFDSEEEHQFGKFKERNIPSSQFVIQLICQINAGTHLLSDDGAIIGRR